jgi:peptide/nickel transport system ATP-binding protein
MTPDDDPVGTAALEVRGLHVEIPTADGLVHPVDDVDLVVHHNEPVGIVGESGSGKSTLVRAILGLQTPPARITAGTVQFGRYADLRSLGRGEWRQIRGAQIGFIGQNPFGALNPILRIEKQFRNILRAHRPAPRDEVRAIAVEKLQEVGISEPERVLSGYAHQLSGGMAQRVITAMAFLLNPVLVIADEPTTGLDVTVQRQVLDLMADLARREHCALLLVTHDLGVVAQYCRQVVVMYAGRVVEAGPTARVFHAPEHPYTAALLEAVPRPDRPLARMKGGVPVLLERTPGCVFAPRCPHTMARCLEVRPIAHAVGHAWTAACHLTGDAVDAASRA